MAKRPDLPTLAAENPEIRGILEDSSVSHMKAARQIGVDEASVRRYLSKLGVTAIPALSDLIAPEPNTERQAPVEHKKPEVPQWKPGVTITGDTAEIHTPFKPFEQSPDDRKMLEEAGLNPDEWFITKTTSHVRFDETGEPSVAQYWLRASKIPVGSISAEDLDAILAQYTSPSPLWEIQLAPERILMVPSGDLQLGKPEGGGTEATIERFARYTDQIAAELADTGGVALLVLPWLGDCIEGIVSQGGRNIAQLDIPVTAQVRVYRRLMVHQLIKLAPYAKYVLMPVVPGNHDQTTREQMMPHTDSWAIEGASAAADYFEGRPGYEHVSWAFPEAGEPHLALKVADELTLGFTHGHVTGGNPAKVIDWWKGQSHGRQPIGEADILVSAHWHHLRVEFTGGGRTWIQVPAMDGGSGWYRHKTGEAVVSGQITVDLTPGVGCGWTNLKVYS